MANLIPKLLTLPPKKDPSIFDSPELTATSPYEPHSKSPIYFWSNEPWPVDFGKAMMSTDLIGDGKDPLRIDYIGASCMRNIELLVILTLVQIAQRLMRIDAHSLSLKDELHFHDRDACAKSAALIERTLKNTLSKIDSETAVPSLSDRLEELAIIESKHGLPAPPTISASITDRNPDVITCWHVIQTSILSEPPPSDVSPDRWLSSILDTQCRTIAPLFLTPVEWDKIKLNAFKTDQVTQGIRQGLLSQSPLFTAHPILYQLAVDTAQSLDFVEEDISLFLDVMVDIKAPTTLTILYPSNIPDVMGIDDCESYILALQDIARLQVVGARRKEVDIYPAEKSARESQTFTDLTTYRSYIIRNLQQRYDAELQRAHYKEGPATAFP